MAPWLVVVILGIVEGLTEFIPVSSTGHLLFVQQLWLPRQSELFNVVIQCGAALALVPLFSKRLREMLFHLHEPENRDLLLKLTVAFGITGVGGLTLKKLGMTLPEGAAPVAWATLIGGFVIFAVEWWTKQRDMKDDITWTVAIAVGASQLIAAAFPGSSRSGSTIMMALILGLNRPRATEFSFLLGIPTLLAAGAYEIYENLHHSGAAHHAGAVIDAGPAPESWWLLLLGTVVSAVVAFGVVKWLIGFVRNHTFNGFALYRVALGVAMLFWCWSNHRG